MLTYVGIAIAVAALTGVTGWVIYIDPVRCRRRNRDMIARRVLTHAGSLDGHHLFVGFPFPQLILDPKARPEVWDDRPRQWVRVLERQGNLLVLEEHGEHQALGCDWYVYCDAKGRAIDWWAVPLDGLPDIVDPDSIFPRDALFTSNQDR